MVCYKILENAKMKPGDKSQSSGYLKRKLAHNNHLVNNFLDSEVEKVFFTTPEFEIDKPYNIKDEEGIPTSTFIGNTQIKLVHFFLKKIGQLQGQNYLVKNNETCYQGFDKLTDNVIISPNDLISSNILDAVNTIAEKLGKNRKISISPAKLIEWESGINICLPHALPTLFFMKLVALTHNLSKEVYQYLSALPLVSLINPPQKTKYLTELYMASFFIKHVKDNHEEFGFVSSEECDKILNQTLLQLASGPCKFIPGCYFLDNNNQFDEQLTEVAMLYHAGIDFRVVDEFNSHFKFEQSNGKPCITWKDEVCKNHLKTRIKQLFHTLFTAAAINQVQVISLLAVGQGELLKFEIAGQALIEKMNRKDAWFYEGVLKDKSQLDKLKDEIRELYSQSLFELLATNDYQFKEVFYNPAQSASITHQMFENSSLTFKCNVTIHNKDCLLLAKNYKKQNPDVSVAFNSPSDPRGVIGNGFWFGRKFETKAEEGSLNYLAEEHIISNSTYILGSSLITNADVDPKKSFWNFNTSQVDNEAIFVNCEPSQIDIDKKKIYLAALIDQYRGKLWCLSLNPYLSAKEKTYLIDIEFSFVEQKSEPSVFRKLFN